MLYIKIKRYGVNDKETVLDPQEKQSGLQNLEVYTRPTTRVDYYL